MARKPKTEEPAKPNPAQLDIDMRYLREGELEKYKGAPEAKVAAFTQELTARALSQPEVRAARTIQMFEGEQLDINACADELRRQIAEVQRGGMKRPEAMLVAQAHTLDALFSSLAIRSKANSQEGYLEAADRYMRLALKAQSQAVRTIETLAEIKNPRPVAFVRQANIAHTQQVNNGIPSHAGETINQSNELLGSGNELLPDARASQAASRVDTPLETVAKINRPTN